MVESLSVPRVPEPAEALAWLRRVPPRVGAYLSAVERRPLWLIVVWSALLRVIYVDLIPLGVAEAHYLAQAKTFLEGGPAATAVAWFPRVISLAMRLGRDPGVIAAVLALGDIVALILLFESLLRYQGWRTAVLSIALLAATPWTALLSRGIAPAALALPLGSFTLIGLQSATLGLNPWGWMWAALAAFLLGVLSPDGLVALVVVAAVAGVYYRRLRGPYLLLGVLLALLITLPTLYFVPENRPLVQAGRFFQPVQDVHSLFTADPLTVYRALLSGGRVAGLIEPAVSETRLWQVMDQVSYIWGWACLLCLPGVAWLGLRAWGRWRESDDHARYIIPALWLGTGLLLYLLRGNQVGIKQYAALLPVGMLSVALVLVRITQPQRSWRYASALFWTIVVASLILGGYASLALHWRISTGETRATYGTPLRQWRRLAVLAMRATTTPADTLWIVSPGIDPAVDEHPAVLTYLIGDTATPVYIRRESAPALLLPAEREAGYVLIGHAPVQQGVLEVWGAQRTGLVVSDDAEQSAQLFQMPSQPVEALLGAIPRREWAAWDAGIRLVGYDRPTLVNDGQALALATYWTFENITAVDRLSRHVLEVSLYDRDGQPVTSRATFGLLESQWREGLLVKQWHVLPLPYALPPEPYEIHLVIDRAGDRYRHPILDDAGRPRSDRSILGPFTFADPVDDN